MTLLGRYFEYIRIVSWRGLEAKLIAELAEQKNKDEIPNVTNGVSRFISEIVSSCVLASMSAS